MSGVERDQPLGGSGEGHELPSNAVKVSNVVNVATIQKWHLIIFQMFQMFSMFFYF